MRAPGLFSALILCACEPATHLNLEGYQSALFLLMDGEEVQLDMVAAATSSVVMIDEITAGTHRIGLVRSGEIYWSSAVVVPQVGIADFSAPTESELTVKASTIVAAALVIAGAALIVAGASDQAKSKTACVGFSDNCRAALQRLFANEAPDRVGTGSGPLTAPLGAAIVVSATTLLGLEDSVHVPLWLEIAGAVAAGAIVYGGSELIHAAIVE